MHRFLIFAFVLFGSNIAGTRRRTALRNTAYVYDVTACPDVKMEGKFNASLKYLGKSDFRVDVDMGLGDKPIYDPEVLVSLEVCPSRALVDCQDYLTYPIDDFCHFMTLNYGPYAAIYQAFDPPFTSCPLKGDYFLRNFSSQSVVNYVMDIYKLPAFPNHHVYKFEFKGLWKKKLIICYRVIGSFRTDRNW